MIEAHPISFGSDNHSGVHPQLLKAITEANRGHSPSYGTDEWTAKVEEVFKQAFGTHVQPFFVFNGTAANVLSLKSLVQSHHAVLCTDLAHLNRDECAAPELIVGCKLIGAPATGGKLTETAIKHALVRRGDQHQAQIKMISITQPTELGTLYSLSELKTIRQLSTDNGLYLHIDGARLIYAAQALGCRFSDFARAADVISFGGTKNGLLYGEAVILCNDRAKEDFKYIRKQCLQLPSKMRFISAQFLEFFNGDPPLWQQIADHGIKMAQLLYAGLADIPEIKITQKVESNAVFAIIPKAWTKALRDKFFFYIWDENTWEVRWMTSFDTTEAQVTDFLEHIKQVRQQIPIKE